MRSDELKQQRAEREKGFDRFHSWEKANPHLLSFEEALAGLDFLYTLLPQEARERPADPQGVGAMRRALSVL